MELYLVTINVLAFLFMFLDKLFAKTGKRRIPEINLILTALMGGSLGATAAMYLFRHKTRHPKFALGLPVLSVLHLIALFFLTK